MWIDTDENQGSAVLTVNNVAPDSNGNVNVDDSSKISKNGNRGALDGYQSVFTTKNTVTIDASSNDVIQLLNPSTITVSNGEKGQYWSKMVNAIGAVNTIQLGSKWIWMGGDEPSETNENSFYIFRWCNDIGVVEFVNGGHMYRTVTGTISLENCDVDIIVQRNYQTIYTLASGGTYTCELGVGDKFVVSEMIKCIDSVDFTLVGEFVTEVYEGFSVSIELEPYTEETPLISAGGRKLYRHSSGMGVVVEFNDGQDRKVLILDARYRFRSSLYKNVDTSLPDVTIDYNLEIESLTGMSDSTLNEYASNDTNTSRYNTDVLLTLGDCEAANRCRSITVNGIGCDIPNNNILKRICADSYELYLLDQSVKMDEYKDLNLSSVWSSTEFYEYGYRTVVGKYLQGRFDKTEDGVICPVLELE